MVVVDCAVTATAAVVGRAPHRRPAPHRRLGGGRRHGQGRGHRAPGPRPSAGVDALALENLDATVSPAAALGTGIPVARLDGQPGQRGPLDRHHRGPGGTVRVRRPELVLAGAVAICLPMVPGVLNGNITAISAGTRFLIAIVICWVAGALLTSVIDRYTPEARRTQALKMLAAARRTPPGPTAAGPPPPAALRRRGDR